ncbi:MAG: nitrous oxide reductase accessory protein NosL [Betaproteobacteria bacterium]|nr:nitrous oxide reductase accessory protein NosL [Betaproteobacteria bacterium]
MIAALFALSACDKPADAPTASASLEPPSDAICALDGMILSDYPGPKGQIRYAGGEADFFCDTTEILSMLLEPEQSRSITGAYVQDMAHTDWEKPAGHWVDAKTAFYVGGSNMHGAMGPTFASFSQRSDADSFAAQHGGKVYAFKELTPQMLKLDGGVINDQGM